MFKIRRNKQYKDMTLSGVSVGYAVLQLGVPIRYETVIGVISDDKHLYYKLNNDIRESVSRVLLTSNQVSSLHVYDSFLALTKEYKQFADKKKLLTNIIHNVR